MNKSQILRSRTRRYKDAVISSVIAALGGEILVFMIMTSARTSGLQLWAMGIPTFIGLYVYYRKMRRDKVIMWLRRFGRDPETDIKFYKILGNACWGIGVPVTVQDSMYRTSILNAFSKTVWFIPFTMFGFILWFGFILYLVLYVGSQLVGEEFVYNNMSGGPFWLFVVLLLFSVSTFVALCYFFIRPFGFARLSVNSAVEKATKIIKKIHARTLTQGPHGVVILKCENSFWQDIVRLVLREADVVVVDVTDVTANILWEITTAFEFVSANKIILVYGSDCGVPETIPEGILKNIEAAVGKEKMQGYKSFIYLRNNRWIVQPQENYRMFQTYLCDKVLDCLVSH